MLKETEKPARVRKLNPNRVKRTGSVSGLEPEGEGSIPSTLTITEFAALGGKARWKGKTKKERSEAMKKVRNGYPHLDEQALDDKQARV